MTTLATTAPARRGRTRVAPRALDRVAAAVAADALGVDAGQVTVDLTDHHGDLGLTVRSTIRALSLTRVRADPHTVSRTGSILERAATAQDTIRERVSALTGSTIHQVTVRITGISIQEEKRVR